MNWVQQLKYHVGNYRLKKESESTRICIGSNFHSAKRIGLLYKDDDEIRFNKIKSFAKHLKDTFDIRSVIALGFVDALRKHLPAWQAQKLEFGFFTKDDLNGYLLPVKNVSPFLHENFDILIDLTDGHEVPINFMMKKSRSGMKVCRKGSQIASSCDFIIDMHANESIDAYIEQLYKYLSNPKIQ